MPEILTLNEIKEFINTNRSQLDKDSTVILTQGNHFSFLKFVSFLNLEGVYDWEVENGDFLKGKHGDVMSFWGESYGTFVVGESSDNKARNHEDFFYNFVFDGLNSVPDNLKDFIKEINQSQGDDSPDKNVLISAIMKDHRVGTGIRIYEPDDITLNYNDSYGHKKTVSPTTPMLAIECELGLKQKFNPDKSKPRNESIIIKFEDFINESKESDDIYHKSLKDDYWKDISEKFPDYNHPDSDDHKKAVSYILSNMRKKYKDKVDWVKVEKDIKNSISDGIS